MSWCDQRTPLPNMLPSFLLLPLSRADARGLSSRAEEDAKEDGLGNIVFAGSVAVWAAWGSCAGVGATFVAGGAVVGLPEVLARSLATSRRAVELHLVGSTDPGGSTGNSEIGANVELGLPTRLVAIFSVPGSCELDSFSEAVAPARGCRRSVVLAGGA